MQFVLLFVAVLFGVAVLGLLWVLGQANLAELRTLNASIARVDHLVESALLGIRPADRESARQAAEDDEAVSYVDEATDLRRELRRRAGEVNPVAEGT